MRKILFLLILLLGTLVGESQTFTFSKMNTQLPTLGIQTVDIDGEVTITDSTITQTLMGMTTITPVLKINDVEYKIKIGDIDIRYKFAPISQLLKDSMKNKKGKWLVKEMEYATHVLITDMVDRFTNQHTIISMYLTPKL
jgi:hypothetical protein